MGPNTESMLRAALVNAEDANIEQVRAGLRDLSAFRAEIEAAKSKMTDEDRATSEWVLEQVADLEERFNTILAEAEGTRMLVATGPAGTA